MRKNADTVKCMHVKARKPPENACAHAEKTTNMHSNMPHAHEKKECMPSENKRKRRKKEREKKDDQERKTNKRGEKNP